MRKAEKIIAAIFASICIVTSFITVIVAFGAKAAQKDPEAFKEDFQQVMDADMSEADREQAEKLMKSVVDYFLELNHKKVLSQGIVGAILSIVILVTVLINYPSMPIVTPAIASLASLGGAIYCGWVIMMFMVITLIGSGLVLLANLQQPKLHVDEHTNEGSVRPPRA